MSPLRLLAGPDLYGRPEPLSEHVTRLGPLPRGAPPLSDLLVHSGVTGRGGAAYPVGLKWRAVAAGSHGSAVVILHGPEGAAHSNKDRLLMTTRPHMVLDGALLAAASVRAKQIVLYIGEQHHASLRPMSEA